MLATGGDDSVIRLWQVNYQENTADLAITRLCEFRNHSAAINGLDFHVLGELVREKSAISQ